MRKFKPVIFGQIHAAGDSLDIHRARHSRVNVNVVAAADPIQSKAQFLQQALQVPEGNVASALLDNLKRLVWARHGTPL
jgi:hypothetical protein